MLHLVNSLAYNGKKNNANDMRHYMRHLIN